MDTSQVRLRLLATTDLHAHLCEWDYRTDHPRPGRGLVALSPLIAAARAGCPNSLLLDNGDFLQGDAMGDWAAERAADADHPMITAMNVLGYDAATVGNHEFSHGLPLLSAAIAAARFPVLSANLRPVDQTFALPATALLDRDMRDDHGQVHRLRIGVTGIAPARTAQWEGRHIDGRIAVLDPVAAASEAVAVLRAAGADLVVLLAHSGPGGSAPAGAQDGTTADEAGLCLSRITGLDALILGHTHGLFPPTPDMPGRLSGIPAVMPGANGSHLGQIDLTLRHDGAGWRVTGDHATLRPAPPGPTAPPPALSAACRSSHDAARRWLATPVGHGGVPLHSHFETVAPGHIARLIAAAQRGHVARSLPPGATDGRPLLSATAPFRATPTGTSDDGATDIAAGPLCLRHAVDLYPHPNDVVALAVTGADLADWLERAAILFHRIAPGARDAPLLRGDVPGFDFDMIDGLSYRIDLSAPPRFDHRGTLVDARARRIAHLSCRGRKVRPEDRFILVTNSYRAAGAGGFAGCHPDRVLLADGYPSRQALIDHIAAGGAMQPPEGFDWGFLPLPGTSVTLDTRPGAERHLSDIAHLHPEPSGPAGRFRLWL